MRILLVNDDGYRAEGILTLERILTEKSHDVCMVAPHTEQSAKSHAMTVHGSVTCYRWDERHYSLEGTPADCVIYSMRGGILPFTPDVVISGINHGYNLSSDTIYSGTCGAARQGAMYSIPAIAISEEKNECGEYDFVSPAIYLESRLEEFVSLLDGADSFLNLNFPPHWNGEVKKARLGHINYYDTYSCDDSGDRLVLTGNGCTVDFRMNEEGEYEGDRTLAGKGYATATIIKINPVADNKRMTLLEL